MKPIQLECKNIDVNLQSKEGHTALTIAHTEKSPVGKNTKNLNQTKPKI